MVYSMRSTFYGIEIGRTGIQVSQRGLDVTGHNIANVDTAGYTRQRLITTAYDPVGYQMKFKTLDLANVGGGARVKILDQVRSKFLDRQFRTEQTLQSYWETRTTGLSYVESLFEGSEMATLTNNIGALFSAFNTMTTEGNDSQQRIVVRSAGQKLITSFGQIYDRLVEQQESQNLAVDTVVKDINTKAEQISQLNKAIYYYELDGQPANDLRDKRSLLLDELSALTDITYYETADNKMVVEIAGTELVNYMTVTKLGTEDFVDPVSGNTYSNVCWLDADGNPIKSPDTTGTDPITGDPITIPGSTILLTSEQLGGELGSHIDLRDSMDPENPGIPYFIEKINTMARAIAETVNNVHRSGYTHPASGSESTKGVNFFDVPALDPEVLEEIPAGSGEFFPKLDYSKVTAKDLALSPEILESEFNIAASTEYIKLNADGTVDTLQEGNQNNARLLYEIFNKTDIVLEDGTSIGGINSFMDGIVLEVATTKSKSQNLESNHNTQLLAVSNQRTSICGVSLDEEMTNMIKYQHAYSGSARVITAMDEALDVLINRMGRVGL